MKHTLNELEQYKIEHADSHMLKAYCELSSSLHIINNMYEFEGRTQAIDKLKAAMKVLGGESIAMFAGLE